MRKLSWSIFSFLTVLELLQCATNPQLLLGEFLLVCWGQQAPLAPNYDSGAVVPPCAVRHCAGLPCWALSHERIPPVRSLLFFDETPQQSQGLIASQTCKQFSGSRIGPICIPNVEDFNVLFAANFRQLYHQLAELRLRRAPIACV